MLGWGCWVAMSLLLDAPKRRKLVSDLVSDGTIAERASTQELREGKEAEGPVVFGRGPGWSSAGGSIEESGVEGWGREGGESLRRHGVVVPASASPAPMIRACVG